MLYMIEVLNVNQIQFSMVTGRTSLPMILNLLEKAPTVVCYKVSFGASTNLKPKDFGWSNLDKWVDKFYTEGVK